MLLILAFQVRKIKKVSTISRRMFVMLRTVRHGRLPWSYSKVEDRRANSTSMSFYMRTSYLK